MTIETSVAVPSELVPALDAYRTCEFTTVNRDGVPIAWPTTTLYDRDSGTFTLTTSIGLAAKAFNVRREPRVAMLFSDPTGSGTTDMPQVVIEGTAVCPDEVITDPARLEQYWTRLYRLQPAGRVYGTNALTRRLFDWYYFRLVITVTPGHVSTRAPLPALPPMRATRVRRRAHDPWSEVVRRLPRYRSAVLSWTGPDGAPRSARVRASAVPGALRVDPVFPQALHPGSASLLCHSHDERLWHLQSFVATGTLTGNGEGWTFTPSRLVPGASATDPRSMVRSLRNARAATERYLDARGLPRPSVPWADYSRLYDTATGAGRRVRR